jgi:hypothetical protein
VHAYDGCFFDHYLDCSVARQTGLRTVEPPPTISEAAEFMSFAEWAFGPNGLPALQVLAFGDFTNENLYSEQQFLVRRKDPSCKCSGKKHCSSLGSDPGILAFCPVNLTDLSLLDGLSLDVTRFLTACPRASLFESPYEL